MPCGQPVFQPEVCHIQTEHNGGGVPSRGASRLLGPLGLVFPIEVAVDFADASANRRIAGRIFPVTDDFRAKFYFLIDFPSPFCRQFFFYVEFNYTMFPGSAPALRPPFGKNVSRTAHISLGLFAVKSGLLHCFVRFSCPGARQAKMEKPLFSRTLSVGARELAAMPSSSGSLDAPAIPAQSPAQSSPPPRACETSRRGGRP